MVSKMLDDKVFICVDVSHVNNEEPHRIDKPVLNRVTEFIELHRPRVHKIMGINPSDCDLQIAMYSMSCAFYRRKPDRNSFIALCINELREADQYPFNEYYREAGVKTLEHRALFTYIHELQHYRQIEIDKTFDPGAGVAYWQHQTYKIYIDDLGKTFGIKTDTTEKVGYYSLPWEIDANTTAINVFKQLNIT